LVLNVISDCNDIVFPSAFTPNDDGINDHWGPIGNFKLISNYELLIYDRWGERVFASYNPFEKWDGKFKNQTFSTGNFVWFSNYTFMGKPRKQKGNCILIK
jgi:gliding motility-associated-like protein